MVTRHLCNGAQVKADEGHSGAVTLTQRCGAGELKIMAAILERPVIQKILDPLGLDPQPPPKGRARESGQDFAA